VAHGVVLDVELPHAQLLGEIPRANERGEAHRLSDGDLAFPQVQGRRSAYRQMLEGPASMLFRLMSLPITS
jgi:hypothetical protein